mgnify:FL=1
MALMETLADLVAARYGPVADAVRIPVREDADLAVVRHGIGGLAPRLGLSALQRVAITTAALELARNIVVHAGFGELLLGIVDAPSGGRGLLFVARDEGPGIRDLTLAMRDGYSSVGSLGLGLPGARRLMDVFEIESVVGRGTTVVCIKWIG